MIRGEGAHARAEEGEGRMLQIMMSWGACAGSGLAVLGRYELHRLQASAAEAATLL